MSPSRLKACRYALNLLAVAAILCQQPVTGFSRTLDEAIKGLAGSVQSYLAAKKEAGVIVRNFDGPSGSSTGSKLKKSLCDELKKLNVQMSKVNALQLEGSVSRDVIDGRAVLEITLTMRDRNNNAVTTFNDLAIQELVDSPEDVAILEGATMSNESHQFNRTLTPAFDDGTKLLAQQLARYLKQQNLTLASIGQIEGPDRVIDSAVTGQSLRDRLIRELESLRIKVADVGADCRIEAIVKRPESKEQHDLQVAVIVKNRVGLPLHVERALISDEKRPRSWFVNSLGLTMCRVPSLATQMHQQGGPGAIVANALAERLYVANREIELGEFRQFVNDFGDLAFEKPATWTEDGASGSLPGDLPVTRVSWHDAILFCNWISLREGRSPCYKRIGAEWEWDRAADGYRLPTGNEWEYACRAGTTSAFHCPRDLRSIRRYVVCEARKPLACGSLTPNAWGLFDCHGNVWEWCWEPIASEPKESKPGRGRDESSIGVIRGGGWRSTAGDCGSASRAVCPRNERRDDVGFRLVTNRELPPIGNVKASPKP